MRFRAAVGRGVLVAGTLAGVDGNVAVLALAADWSLFDAYFRQSYLTGVQSPPPSLGLDLQIDKSEPTGPDRVRISVHVRKNP